MMPKLLVIFINQKKDTLDPCIRTMKQKSRELENVSTIFLMF